MSIPLRLESLFQEMDFIGEIPANHKLCTKDRCYVDAKSWIGWTYRKFLSENNELTIAFILKVCRSTDVELKNCVNTDFNDLLIEKSLLLRTGIIKLRDTYIKDVRTSNALSSSLLILDFALPEKIKIDKGIIAPLKFNDNSWDRKDIKLLDNFEEIDIEETS